MSDYTQKNRPICISTPLGEDKLLLRKFVFEDELCRPFRMEMELQSTDASIDFDKILGAKVTVEIKCPNYQTRKIHGYISEFSQVDSDTELFEYRAVMVPWVWMLSQKSNCIIHKNKNVPTLVQEVMADLGLGEVSDLTTASDYTEMPFCVQYDETDLNFVSRLMERAGIYYFFENEEKKAKLVLCDSPGNHEAFPGYSSIPYNAHKPAAGTPEHIYKWTQAQEVKPSTVELQDYDYNNPKKQLLTNDSATQGYTNGDYSGYHYPGHFTTKTEGTAVAKLRVQGIQSRQTVYEGVSDCMGIVTGYKFTLQRHPREDQNQEYLVTGTRLTVQTSDYSTGGSGETEEYQECCFRALQATKNFRPPLRTPVPKISGTQTATVVSNSADDQEVDADEYGRVYVTFHWDSGGRNDQTEEGGDGAEPVTVSHDQLTILIRVSQSWAGKDWGAQFTPHVGTEVVVAFEEGDPDRPLIIGRVYNADQAPPISPKSNPYVGRFEDSSTKNWWEMDATADKEKLSVVNGSNKLLMDSTTDSEKITITDGKNSVVWDPNKGQVKTNNYKDASHWSGGKWNEYVAGIKSSIVFGLYFKLYMGSEFGITAGNKTSIVLGPEIKYNGVIGAAGGLGTKLACAKFEVYSGNCYKIIFGEETKVETKGRKKLNPLNSNELHTKWSAVYSTKAVASAIKDEEKVAGEKSLMASLANTKIAGAYKLDVGAASIETVKQIKGITAGAMVLKTNNGMQIAMGPTGFNLMSPSPMKFNGVVINLN